MPKLVPQLWLDHCVLKILFFLRRRRENPCRGHNLRCKEMILQIQSCHLHPQTQTRMQGWEGQIQTNFS